MGNTSSKGESDASEPPLEGGKHKAKLQVQNQHKGSINSASSGGSSDVGGSNNSLMVQQAQGSMTRSASGADVTEKYLTQLVPVEKLAEILREQSSAKFGVNGIVSDVFVVSNWPMLSARAHS